MNLLFILFTTRLFKFGWPILGNHGWTGWLVVMREYGFLYTGAEIILLENLFFRSKKGKCRCFVGGHAITGIVTCDGCGGWIDHDEYGRELKKLKKKLNNAI